MVGITEKSKINVFETISSYITVRIGRVQKYRSKIQAVKLKYLLRVEGITRRDRVGKVGKN